MIEVKPLRRKLYTLDHKKHGIGGVTYTKPTPRAQDKRAAPDEGYAVVFFPKIAGIGKARVGYRFFRTFSQTPEAARVKFMDSIAKGQKWASYAKAGWRVRRVKVTDMGDA